MTREEAIKILNAIRVYECYPKSASEETKEAIDMAIEALSVANLKEEFRSVDAVQGEWISEIDTGTCMLKCSVCGCRVQEEKYRIAVGENATKCPYCGAELGLGGYQYDEYANRPSERKGGDDE